jgi:site-specific recombinase XerD
MTAAELSVLIWRKDLIRSRERICWGDWRSRFSTRWATSGGAITPRWLVPDRRGDAPPSTQVLSDTFAAAVVAAGIRRDVTPQALRHSYASRLIENGVDIRIVPILPGHAATAIYTHITTPPRMSLHDLLDRLMSGL